MVYANPYFRASKLSEGTFCRILDCFAMDLTATVAAELAGVSVRSVNAIFLRIRQRSAEYCQAQSPLCLDAGAAREGQEDCGKNIVLGLLEQCGRVYTEIVPSPMKAMLQALIRGQLSLQSVVVAGAWRGYDGLVDLEFERCFRVRQGGAEGGIEAFWAFTQDRLRKFHGLSGRTFGLHLKECEFRFNHRGQDLFQVLQGILLQRPL